MQVIPVTFQEMIFRSIVDSLVNVLGFVVRGQIRFSQISPPLSVLAATSF